MCSTGMCSIKLALSALPGAASVPGMNWILLASSWSTINPYFLDPFFSIMMACVVFIISVFKFLFLIITPYGFQT